MPYPKPVLVDPPAVIVESLKYTGKVWTWANGPGIIFTASKTDPRHYKVIAAHDDVDNWKRISGKLPRWCFVFINGRLASNGQYFIGYPMVLWQGKEYYFGESRPTETVLGDYAPYPIKPLVIQFSPNRLAMGCVDDKGIRRHCQECPGCASARQFPAVQRQRAPSIGSKIL